jgi:hypothetical protein
MQVVIEIDDWSDNDGLLRELRMLQAEADRIASDPEYDPDDEGAPMALRTSGGHTEIGVARIVGTVDRPESTGYIIRPLES